MSIQLETFLTYYTAWHEHEFGLAEMKNLLLDEIGADGLQVAIKEFQSLIPQGRTYYKVQKEQNAIND